MSLTRVSLGHVVLTEDYTGDRNFQSSLPACIYVGMPTLTEFNLAEAVAVLTRTPATLDAMLRGLPNTWVRCNEGKDTWSAFDIVGHLIVGERTDWMPRLRIILENGEARPFDPFDRFAQFRETQGKSLEQLLDEFARLRSENLAALQRTELTAGRLYAARQASGAGSGDAVGTSGDMDDSRPHAFASTVARDGTSVS